MCTSVRLSQCILDDFGRKNPYPCRGAKGCCMADVRPRFVLRAKDD